MKRVIAAIVVLVLIAAGAVLYFQWGETATLTVEEGTGPQPKLPEPNPTLIPTVNVADASSWPEGAKPTAAPGMTVAEFAGGLDHPRWLHVLPMATSWSPKPTHRRNRRTSAV